MILRRVVAVCAGLRDFHAVIGGIVISLAHLVQVLKSNAVAAVIAVDFSLDNEVTVAFLHGDRVLNLVPTFR